MTLVKTKGLFDNFIVRPFKVDLTNSYVDSESMTGSTSLIIKAQASHSMRVTSNGLLYLPSVLRDAAPSFITPFPKPILIEHEGQSRPIGRIVDAKYVTTPSPRMPDATFNFFDSVKKATSTVKTLDTYYDAVIDPMFAGLGYIDITAKISDQEAIRDIMSGLYLTMSIGFDVPGDIINSVDGKSVFSEDNDFYPGDFVDGKKVYGIPTSMLMEEVSYVNKPADWFATTYEFALSDSKHTLKNIVHDSSLSFTTDYDLYLDNQVEGKSVISKIYTIKKEQDNGGKMKIKFSNVVSDAKACYDAMKKFLPEASVLSEEAFAKLEDSKFAGGAKRTFPIIDAAHKEAALKLLAEFEESKSNKVYQPLVDSINAIELPATEAVVAVVATTEVVPPVATVDMSTKDPRDIVTAWLSNLTDEAIVTSLKDSLKGLDKAVFTTFYNIVKDMAISLEVELGSAAIEKLQADKADSDALVDILKGQLDNAHKSVKAANVVLADNQKEMKTFYCDQIAELRVKAGTLTEDAKADAIVELGKRSLDSLKDSLTDLKAVTAAKATDTKTFVDNKVQDPTTVAKTDVDTILRDKIAAIYKKADKLGLTDKKAADEFLKLKMDELRAELAPKKAK